MNSTTSKLLKRSASPPIRPGAALPGFEVVLLLPPPPPPLLVLLPPLPPEVDDGDPATEARALSLLKEALMPLELVHCDCLEPAEPLTKLTLAHCGASSSASIFPLTIYCPRDHGHTRPHKLEGEAANGRCFLPDRAVHRERPRPRRRRPSSRPNSWEPRSRVRSTCRGHSAGP